MNRALAWTRLGKLNKRGTITEQYGSIPHQLHDMFRLDLFGNVVSSQVQVPGALVPVWFRCRLASVPVWLRCMCGFDACWLRCLLVSVPHGFGASWLLCLGVACGLLVISGLGASVPVWLRCLFASIPVGFGACVCGFANPSLSTCLGMWCPAMYYQYYQYCGVM